MSTLKARIEQGFANDAHATAVGSNGHVFVTDGTYSSDVFGVIVPWDGANCTVNYTVIQRDGTEIAHTGVVITFGGFPIYGRITGVTVTSGKACCYYK